MGSKKYFPRGDATRGRGFLDPGDVENRDQAGYQPDPPSFSQPGHVTDSGRDLTNPPRERRGGDLKFGSID